MTLKSLKLKKNQRKRLIIFSADLERCVEFVRNSKMLISFSEAVRYCIAKAYYYELLEKGRQKQRGPKLKFLEENENNNAGEVQGQDNN